MKYKIITDNKTITSQVNKHKCRVNVSLLKQLCMTPPWEIEKSKDIAKREFTIHDNWAGVEGKTTSTNILYKG